MLSCHLLFRGAASSRHMNTYWHISKMWGTSKSSVHTAEVYSAQTLMAKSQRCNIHPHPPRLPCSDKDEACCTTPDLYGNGALCFLHCVHLGVLFVERHRNLFRYLQDPISTQNQQYQRYQYWYSYRSRITPPGNTHSNYRGVLRNPNPPATPLIPQF